MDIRFKNIAVREDIFQRLQLICEATEVDGTSSSFEITGQFSPLNLSDK